MITDALEQRLLNPVFNNKFLNTRPVEKTEAKVQFEIMNDYLKNGDTKGFVLAREEYFSIKIEDITSEIKRNNSKNAYNSLVSLRGLIADSTNPDDVINRALGAYADGNAQKYVDAEMDSNRTIPLEGLIVNIDEVGELHGEAKIVVDETCRFYRNKAKWPDMPGYKHARKYILLTGKPGTGKTTVAKFFAHRMNADLIVVNPAVVRSSGFGDSAARMKSIFDQIPVHCDKTGKAIILFIDEVDQIARTRSSDTHEATQSILSQLLVYMDGVEGTRSGLNIMMLFATNCEDMIDPAFKSRNKVINIPVPDFTTRVNIVKSMLKESPHRVSMTDTEVGDAVIYTEPQYCLKGSVNYCFTGRDLERAVETASDFAIARFESSGIGAGPQILAADLIYAFKQGIESLAVVHAAPPTTGRAVEPHSSERAYELLHGTYQQLNCQSDNDSRCGCSRSMDVHS